MGRGTGESRGAGRDRVDAYAQRQDFVIARCVRLALEDVGGVVICSLDRGSDDGRAACVANCAYQTAVLVLCMQSGAGGDKHKCR